jgi:hypothetical protein
MERDGAYSLSWGGDTIFVSFLPFLSIWMIGYFYTFLHRHLAPFSFIFLLATFIWALVSVLDTVLSTF